MQRAFINSSPVAQACHIFALDEDVKNEVANMKRALLRLLNVREFSAQAKFQDPSRSVVLPDVLCSSNLCASARDIDLCREHDVISSVTRVVGGGLHTEMKCHHCQLGYDTEMIEQRLVQSLHQVPTYLYVCVCLSYYLCVSVKYSFSLRYARVLTLFVLVIVGSW